MRVALGEVVEFIRSLPGVSSGEIGHAGPHDDGEYSMVVRVSAQAGSKVPHPYNALREAVLSTLQDGLWMNMPGSKSSDPAERFPIYTIRLDP